MSDRDHKSHVHASGAQPLERLARQVMEKSLAKRGFASADLITNWAVIAGENLARVTEPERLKINRGKQMRGATLVIRVDRAALLEVQMSQPVLLERVNAYMGLGSVEKIVFTPADIAPSDLPPSPVSEAETAPAEPKGSALDVALAALEKNARGE